jgi:hypothetical protein
MDVAIRGVRSLIERGTTIDRITGNLNISGVSDGQTVRMIGKCEKSDEMKQAF